MKNIYEHPECAVMAISSADVITESGIGYVTKWNAGLIVDEASAIDDEYGN